MGKTESWTEEGTALMSQHGGKKRQSWYPQRTVELRVPAIKVTHRRRV